VLVVDDDPAAGAATQATLSSGGYAVTAEAAGDAVLRLVRASMVQLVISELHVPCTEGRCVIAALKGDRLRLPRLRVLVLTRHTSPDDLEWALGVGADAVVRKPASEAVLLREVARLLNGVPTA
jgi:CheY-like chemotaxis protein